MEKRELSSTLRNLKFMQRVAQKEEKTKKLAVDQADVGPSVTLPSSFVASRKCIVIVEGDPPPGGSMKGRMSFQSFNPSIDKLSEEPITECGTATPDQHGSNEEKKVKSNGEHKRKQLEGEGSESGQQQEHTNKSPKMDQDQDQHQHSSQKNHGSGSSSKRQKKLDWNVLRPPNKRSN